METSQKWSSRVSMKKGIWRSCPKNKAGGTHRAKIQFHGTQASGPWSPAFAKEKCFEMQSTLILEHDSKASF